MQRLLCLIGSVICLGMTAASGSPSRGGHGQNPQDRFTGAWRLVWLEEPDGTGKVHRTECTGLLVYTSDGHMSVQVMYRPQTGGQGGPVQYALGGYEASFGTYKVDEGARTFTFHVEGAMVRSLIGKNLLRAYEFSGNRLTMKSSNPNEHWRVAWERY
jgi:hypothetical protein